MSVVERQDRGCEGGMGGEAQGHPEPPSEARDVGTGPSVAREAGVTTSSPQCTERPKWCTPMDMAEKAEGEARALSDLDENRSGGTQAHRRASHRRPICHDPVHRKAPPLGRVPCSGSACPPNTQFPATPSGGGSFNYYDQKETVYLEEELMQNVGPVHLGTKWVLNRGHEAECCFCERQLLV